MADFQGDSSTSFHDSHEIPEKRRKLDDEPLIIELNEHPKVETVAEAETFRSDTKNFDGNSTNEQKTSSESPTSSTAVVEPSPCESDWNNTYLSTAWIFREFTKGTNPRQIVNTLFPNLQIPSDINDTDFYLKLLAEYLDSSPKRQKISSINTLDDAVELIRNSKKILVLTGAGVSVSCGIPDFRSRDGIYARLHADYPELSEPQFMFDINFFNENPHPFFKFAREIYPGEYKPSRSHRFIARLEQTNRLLRNYSQNIDTLESIAGIKRVLHCHGSFDTATCTTCQYHVPCDTIKADIFNQIVPRCPICYNPEEEEEDTVRAKMKSIMKPDIVFFGENLPDHFHRQMATDKNEVDLVIVIGTSLKVKPVSSIPDAIPGNIPQILINRERLSSFVFDVELLGDCDKIISELSRKLGGEFEDLFDEELGKLSEVTEIPGLAWLNDFKHLDNSSFKTSVNNDSLTKLHREDNLQQKDLATCSKMEVEETAESSEKRIAEEIEERAGLSLKDSIEAEQIAESSDQILKEVEETAESSEKNSTKNAESSDQNFDEVAENAFIKKAEVTAESPEKIPGVVGEIAGSSEKIFTGDVGKTVESPKKTSGDVEQIAESSQKTSARDVGKAAESPEKISGDVGKTVESSEKISEDVERTAESSEKTSAGDVEKTAESSEKISEDAKEIAESSEKTLKVSTKEFGSDQNKKEEFREEHLCVNDLSSTNSPIRLGQSVSDLLPNGCFYFNQPSQYIFAGAEISVGDLVYISDSSDQSESGDEETTILSRDHKLETTTVPTDPSSSSDLLGCDSFTAALITPNKFDEKDVETEASTSSSNPVNYDLDRVNLMTSTSK